MESMTNFSYAGNLWPQHCHFCGTNKSVKYWVTLKPKTIVPACNKCVALRIENKCK